MEEKQITYNYFIIKIIPQPKTGDFLSTFFSVIEDRNKEIIRLWQKISGTSLSKASLSEKKAYELLEKDGLRNVKRLIDSNEPNNNEVDYWSGE